MPHDAHLIKKIRAAVKSRNVFISSHAAKRMKQRKISTSMVFEAMLKGTTDREPEPNILHGSIEVELHRYSAGVHYSVVVAVIDDEIMVSVVTVY